jgi:hypothetical protein
MIERRFSSAVREFHPGILTTNLAAGQASLEF